MNAPEEHMFTVTQASHAMNVSIAGIHYEQKIGTISIDDGKIKASDLEAWAESRGNSPDPQMVRALAVLSRWKTSYTTGEVAKVLGASVDFVIRRIDAGEIEGYRLPNLTDPDTLSGGARRVTRLALAAYLTRHPCAMASAMGRKVAPAGQAK